MRVIQTRNDTIRLIFNPKTDGLCLCDFLIVRDGKDNFLGQIVEIYDDKFNAEENVANIRLVYRVLPDHQIVPYDNFTPSRECEIAKIKLSEIEKCINADKVSVPFGISGRTNKVVSLNLDFFNNNPVVFADKLDETWVAFENIAQKLKQFKKVVVIDFTGNFNIVNAKRIKACADFKMPLDFYSLDYIWKKGLEFASIELQTKMEEIFSELKKFVNSTEDKYIPFPRFVKVIEQQYKAYPAPELQMLLVKLRKFRNDNLFARSKKEAEGILRTIQGQDVTIIDLSTLKMEWHKEFLEFAARQAGQVGAYFLVRLNDNNSNPEIINDLYNKNPNLTIIPSVSYGFKKLPQVMEYAKNYILFKTLNPRRDFGFANFQIAALNSASMLAFGEDTKDFMFVLKNYVFDEKDLSVVEGKKLYIDLNLELEEMTPVELEGSNFEIKNVHIQKRLDREVELDDVLNAAGQTDEDNLSSESDVSKLPADEDLEDIPLVLEGQEPQNEVERYNYPSNSEYTLEEVATPSRFAVPDIVTKHLDEAVSSSLSDGTEELAHEPADEAETVTDLIEASLKNDELYAEENGLKSEQTAVSEGASDKAEEADIENAENKEGVENETMNEVGNTAENTDVKEETAETVEAPVNNEVEEQTAEAQADEAVIPVPEEDLDYFTNPVEDEEVSKESENVSETDSSETFAKELAEQAEAEQKEDELAKELEKAQNADEDNAVTPDMIEEAAQNDALADEIQKQAEQEPVNPKKEEKSETAESVNNVKAVEEPVAQTVETVMAQMAVEPAVQADEPAVQADKEQQADEEPEKDTDDLHALKEEALKQAEDEKEKVQDVPSDAVEASEFSPSKPEPLPDVEEPEPVHIIEAETNEVSADVQNAVSKLAGHSEVSTSVPKQELTEQAQENVQDLTQLQTQAQELAQAQNLAQAQAPVQEQPQAEPVQGTQALKEKVQSEAIMPAQPEMLAAQEQAPVKKPKNPDEAVIIVKEKPNLIIEDYTEEEPEKSEENEEPKQDGVSLSDIAKQSINARFSEVISEDIKKSDKNRLKINDNVSIDLEQIKNSAPSDEPALPIFDNETPDEEENSCTEYQEGMSVTHAKYGKGVVLKVVKYSNRCLLQIEFENSGKRLLDPKMADIQSA